VVNDPSVVLSRAVGVRDGLSIVCVSFLVVYDVECADVTLAEFLGGLQLGY
jgi:hypothetical protein